MFVFTLALATAAGAGAGGGGGAEVDWLLLLPVEGKGASGVSSSEESRPAAVILACTTNKGKPT